MDPTDFLSYLVDTADRIYRLRSSPAQILWSWSSNPIGLTNWKVSHCPTTLYAAANSTRKREFSSHPSIRTLIMARERVFTRLYNH